MTALRPLPTSVYGARIRRARRLKGFSLKTVGAITGLGLMKLSRIETGEQQLRLGDAVAICACIDLPLVELVAWPESLPDPLVWDGPEAVQAS